MPLVKQELFTLPEHIISPLFYRSWCWSIFSFMCSVLWIVGCPFVHFWWIVWQLSFGHCVVCPSSTYGFWLLFWYLMKNSKVHKVWMLIIKKRKSYKQVYTFCVNKYKQNGKRITEYLNVIQCLLVNDAPFYRLVFERWRTISHSLLNMFWFNFIYRITR
jgi:hypothetical protein